mmetsp:Transcript_28223/g.32326  ORF Transcript_28223/g.32326 Transcript_28223/m.32326 type:complete len:107 (+) Transcript_28223:199-519(+)
MYYQIRHELELHFCFFFHLEEYHCSQTHPYCNALFDFNSLINSNCLSTLTKVFAAIVPEAATPGKPIPGNVVSPHANKPLIGVIGPGNSQTSFPSGGAGPYVPRNL